MVARPWCILIVDWNLFIMSTKMDSTLHNNNNSNNNMVIVIIITNILIIIIITKKCCLKGTDWKLAFGNPGCTQARKFHLFFSPACHCESKLYLAIRQVLDSLMTCVRVTHTFALSPDKVCLLGLCRNLLTEMNSYPFQALWLKRVLHSL